MSEETAENEKQEIEVLKHARLYFIGLTVILTVLLLIMFVVFRYLVIYEIHSVIVSLSFPSVEWITWLIASLIPGLIVAYYTVARLENNRTGKSGTRTISSRYHQASWLISWYMIVGLFYGIVGLFKEPTPMGILFNSIEWDIEITVDPITLILYFTFVFIFNLYYPVYGIFSLFYLSYLDFLFRYIIYPALYLSLHVISLLLVYRFRNRVANIPSKLSSWAYIAFNLLSWPFEILAARVGVARSRVGDRLADVSRDSSKTAAGSAGEDMTDAAGEVEGIKVFFSYATKDSDRYRIPELAKLLEGKAGIGRVYYWEQHASGSIIEYMDKRVKASDTCVFFYSKAAVESKPLKMERDMAVYQNKHVIPVFTDIDDVPGILRIQAGVDAKNRSPEEVVEEIYRLVREHHGNS